MKVSIFQSYDNVFGGHDFLIDEQNYHMQDNIFNGETIYQNGQAVATTIPNALDGMDIYDANNQLIVSTSANVLGGETVFDSNHQQLGNVSHTSYGESFTDMSNIVTHYPMDHSAIDTILNYQDPLAHVNSFVLPSLIL